MKKTIKISAVLLAVVLIGQIVSLYHDKRVLQENLIRLHIVANSDSEEDQRLKLMVKDKINNYLQPAMANFKTKDDAERYLKQNLRTIEEIATAEVTNNGYDYPVTVCLEEKAFDTRVYSTFSLPEGIYNALCVNIGAAAGKNWWCVAFPSLCLPNSCAEFVETATQSGISDELSKDLLNTGEFRIRFYFLEQLGKLEKFLHGE